MRLPALRLSHPVVTPLARRMALALASFFLLPASSFAAQWMDVATISSTLTNTAGRLCIGGGRTDLGCPTNAPFLDTAAGLLTVPGDLRVSGNLYVSGSQSFDGVTFANGGVSATGTISATNFYGNGSGLTGVAANWYGIPNIPLPVQAVSNGTAISMAGISATNISVTNNLTVGGALTAGSAGFGPLAATSISASTGRIANDFYVGGNFYVSGSQSIDGVSFANGGVSATGTVTATNFSGNGSGITDINYAANPVDRIISGTTSVLTTNNASVTFTTAGNPAMTLGTNGYLGIGTSTPTGQLHISGTSPYIILDGPVSTDRFLTFRENNGSKAGVVWRNSGGQKELQFINYTSGGNLTFQTGIAGTAERIRINALGQIGISTSTPQTTLDVNGAIRMAMDTSATTNTCDTNRAGAIRYNGGKFQVCYGTGGWANLTDASSTVATADRITSGTAQVIANGLTNSISITEAGITTGYYYGGVWVAGGVSTTGGISGSTGYFAGNVGIGTTTPSTSLVIAGPFGSGGPAFVISATDAIYMTTLSTNALTFQRPNSVSYIDQKGIGGYITTRLSSATTGDTTMMNVSLNGLLVGGIANTSKSKTMLEVSGTFKLSSGGEACDTNRTGAIRYVANNFQVCYGTGGWANLADASSTVATADRITSGTAQVIANGTTNSISITESGVTTGYYYGGVWVAGGVSTTGTISSTNGYISNSLSIGTTSNNLGGFPGGRVVTLNAPTGQNSVYELAVNNTLIGSVRANTNLAVRSHVGPLALMADSGNIVLYPNNTEAMRVTTAGLVGIGTTAPSTTLHVVNPTATTATGSTTITLGTPWAGAANGYISYVNGASGGGNLYLGTNVAGSGYGTVLINSASGFRVDTGTQGGYSLYAQGGGTGGSIYTGRVGINQPFVGALRGLYVSGSVAIGNANNTNPSTTLDVTGAIRMAMDTSSTMNTCDTDRAGAIRYTGGNFQVCYGTGGWANLADASSTVATADRITSGTAQVIANGLTNSISITEAGVTTGYYYGGVWVAGGVSTTGVISATGLYVTGTTNLNGLTYLNSAQISLNNASGNFLVGRGNMGGTNNTSFGYGALAATTGGGSNVAVGNYTFQTSTNGASNVAVGYGAGNYSSGSRNVLLGRSAGFGSNGISTYSDVIAIGPYAGASLTTGVSNTIIGSNAARTLTTGSYNILLGANIQPYSDTGSNQLNIGNALYGDIGSGASNANKLGINVTSPTTALEVSGTISGTIINGKFVGDGSGLTGVTAASADRIISGTAQMIANGNSNSISITEAGVTTGYYYGGVWVAGGVSTTGVISTTGLYVTGTTNIFGPVIVTGTANITGVISTGSQFSQMVGSNNVALGRFTGLNGNQVTNVGIYAGQTNSSNNTVNIGYTAGGSSSGASAVFIGSAAGQNNIGQNTIGIGSGAAQNNNAIYTTAVGSNALQFNTGTSNTALGALAMFNKVAGADNVAVGANAGQGVTNTTAYSRNTLIGSQAGNALTTGSSNTLIGYAAGSGISTGSGNILIGSSATTYSNTGSNQLNIGNALYGNIGSGSGFANLIGINVTSPTANLEVSGTISGTLLTGKFVGDGSGLTGVIAAGSDRITSGTAQMIANGNTNSISITEAGVTTGYYYNGIWVAKGVSTTGVISTTGLYVTGTTNANGNAIFTNGFTTFNSSQVYLATIGGTQRGYFDNQNNIFNWYGPISTGTIRASNGTTSAPSYNFSAEQTTGLSRPVPGAIGFSTSGSEVVRINNVATSSITLEVSGSIRTSSWTYINGNKAPTTPLEVSGTVSATNFVGSFTGDGSGLTGVIAAGSDRITSGTAQMIANGNTNSISITEAGVTTGYYYGGKWVAGGVSTTGIISTTNLYVTGTVGIRTISPTAVLHMVNPLYSDAWSLRYAPAGVTTSNRLSWYNGATETLYINGNDNVTNSAIGFSTNRLDIAAGGTGGLTITSANNVGIGTTAPSNSLHVSGTIRYDTAGTYTSKIFANSTAAWFQTGINAATSSVNNFYFTGWNGDPIQMVITSNSRVGMGANNTNPSTTLHVSGTIRIADSGEACDTNRSGAIRYNSGSFDFCDGTNGWRSLATMASAGGVDKIVSGTTNVTTSNNTSITFTTAGTQAMVIGTNGYIGIGSGFTGTVTPSSEVHISSTRTTGNAPFLLIQAGKAATNAASVAYQRLNSTQQTLFSFETGNSSNPDGYIGTVPNKTGAIYILGGAGTAPLGTMAIDKTTGLSVGTYASVTAATPAAQITPAGQAYFLGNMSVGTTASSATLHVAGNVLVTSWTYLNANPAVRVTPTAPLEVSGTVSATRFVGDGSGLTGVTAASADRIISGTAQVIANGNSNSISITEAGVTTGYYYGGVWVAGGVSTTGTVSATSVYAGNFGTSGSLVYRDASGLLTASSTFVVSSTNGSMAVGTTGVPTWLGNYGFYADGQIATNSNFRAGGSGYLSFGTNSTAISGNQASGYLALTTGATERMRVVNLGQIGISTSTPSTTLHVVGSIRMGQETSTTLNTCDTNRSGAIRYNGSTFQVCYGTGGWANLADASSTVATADRITSGTAQVIANGNSNSISITEAGVTTGYYYGGVWVAGGVSTTGGVSMTTGYVSNSLYVGGVSNTFNGLYLSNRNLYIDGVAGSNNGYYININGKPNLAAGTPAMMIGTGISPRTPMTGPYLKLGTYDETGALRGGVYGFTGLQIEANANGVGAHYGNYISMTTSNQAIPYGVYSVVSNGSTGNRAAYAVYADASNTTGGNAWAFYANQGNSYFKDAVGFNTLAPSTTVHINGSVRLGQETSTTLNTCDTNRSGAIRYNGTTFQVCYGTGGWANLADASSTVATADRITSGTAQVIANGNSNSISITEAGVTTGYYYGGVWVAGGVSTTGKISATSLYVSGTVGIGTNTPLGALHISQTTPNSGAGLVVGYRGTGNFQIRNYISGTAAYLDSVASDLYLQGAYRNFYNPVGGSWGSAHIFTTQSPMTYAAGGGTTKFFDSSVTWAPTSTNGDFAADYKSVYINQTGTATGNYSGLVVNVFETSATGTNNALLRLLNNNAEKFVINPVGGGRFSSWTIINSNASATAPLEVSGTVSATNFIGKFVGDGSGLTGVIAAGSDRITSGTAQVIANGNSNSISITEAGVTTGYYYGGNWVMGGVSTTGAASLSTAFTRNLTISDTGANMLLNVGDAGNYTGYGYRIGFGSPVSIGKTGAETGVLQLAGGSGQNMQIRFMSNLGTFISNTNGNITMAPRLNFLVSLTDPAGRMGVNTLTPSATLHVNGNVLTTSWTGINFSSALNVTPTAPLEVSGTVSATQFVGKFVGDGSGLTGAGVGTFASLTDVYVSTTTGNLYGPTSIGSVASGKPNNTAFGVSAMPGLSGGFGYNSVYGYRSGYALTTGYGNTAVGALALTSTTGGGVNTAVGYAALQANLTGNENTAVGSSALTANTSGGANVAYGSSALSGNTTGSSNTSIGYQAMASNVGGSYNTALGYIALLKNTSGANNLAMGVAPMQENTTGSSNTVAGFNTMLKNVTGSNNAIFGANALRSATAGSNNAVLGASAAYGAAGTLNANSIVGAIAGSNLSTASSNTLLGYAAGNSLTTGSANIMLGVGADAQSATGSWQLNIGNAIYGNIGSGTGLANLIGINVTSPTANLEISGTISATAFATPILTLQGISGSAGVSLTAASTADNLGNHIATQNLVMSGFSITSVTNVSASGNISANQFIGDGSLLTGIASGDRIVSGSTYILASQNTSLTLTTAGAAALTVGPDQRIDVSSTGLAIRYARMNFGNVLEPKLQFWAGVNGMYGIGMSNNQLNYVVGTSNTSHVFFSGGTNNDGTELLRINSATLSSTTLTVSGSAAISGSLKLSTTTDPCNSTTYGTMMVQNGKLYLCRP